MSIAHAYESKLMKAYAVNEIRLEIAKSQIQHTRDGVSSEVIYITEKDAVAPFFYPLYDKERDCVYVDARAWTGVERDGTLKIRNSGDDELYRMLAELELVWNRNNEMDYVHSSFTFSNEMFIRWLAETITHRYGLTPYQSTRVMALVGMYNLGQYYNSLSNDVATQRMLQNMTRHLPLDFQTVLEVAERIEYQFPRDIDEFVLAIQRLELGPRLSDFNTTSLYNILNGSWWANVNSPQLVALAIEYPPAMAALVYMATRHTFYKRTGIGQRVEKANRSNNFPLFHKALRLLLDRYVKSA